MGDVLVWSGVIVLAVCTLYRGYLRSAFGRQQTSPIRGSRTAMLVPLVVMAIMWGITYIAVSDGLLAWVAALLWGLATTEVVIIARSKGRPA
ncbi:hypothetical protein AB0L75_38320 [Streptomyces sp. NPDC052101]|uniref:hypothetical protein n=1 Tax=Streptomyces sp. NPDC052101 TaxID=3155763 RepID=UPI00341B49D7